MPVRPHHIRLYIVPMRCSSNACPLHFTFLKRSEYPHLCLIQLINRLLGAGGGVADRHTTVDDDEVLQVILVDIEIREEMMLT